jgi:hypothetical protein
MITVLPIMLHHLYGPRVWSLFTDKAKAEISGWIYDKTFGRAVSPDKWYTLLNLSWQFQISFYW